MVNICTIIEDFHQNDLTLACDVHVMRVSILYETRLTIIKIYLNSANKDRRKPITNKDVRQDVGQDVVVLFVLVHVNIFIFTRRPGYKGHAGQSVTGDY